RFFRFVRGTPFGIEESRPQAPVFVEGPALGDFLFVVFELVAFLGWHFSRATIGHVDTRGRFFAPPGALDDGALVPAEFAVARALERLAVDLQAAVVLEFHAPQEDGEKRRP